MSRKTLGVVDCGTIIPKIALSLGMNSWCQNFKKSASCEKSCNRINVYKHALSPCMIQYEYEYRSQKSRNQASLVNQCHRSYAIVLT